MESTATKGRAPARSTRLTGRDYVVLAVFGVLLFAVFMVFSIVCSLSAPRPGSPMGSALFRPVSCGCTCWPAFPSAVR